MRNRLIIVSILIAAVSIFAVIMVFRFKPETVVVEPAANLPELNAARYPERFIGTKEGYSFINDEGCDLRSLNGKYSFDYGLFEDEGPLRTSLIEMIGDRKFAMLYTFYTVATPIIVIDDWVIITQMREHAAYESATIFIDIANELMYVQWIDDQASILFYGLKWKEKASPSAILERELPGFVRERLIDDLIPDLRR